MSSDLSDFAVGDLVTIHGPSDGKLFLGGSHAKVLSIGTKRVKVEIVTGAFPGREGEVHSILPWDLCPGHTGTPRVSDRLTEASADFLMDVLADAVEDAVIDTKTAQAIHDSWSRRRS